MSKDRHEKEAGVLRSSVIAAAFFALEGAVFAAPLSESKVFDWWDNGIITAEEATEILDLLEEGNQEEACLLAQTYAQEPCDETASGKTRAGSTLGKISSSKKSTKAPTRPSLTPHGYIDWKGRIDSTGHLESHRTELQVQFYRYTLRLGSQELLAYKNQGSEAYFGDISTRELHSQIPLDTLWGTALLYPFGNFHVAGLLDTAKTTQFRLGYGRRGIASVEAFYWHGFGNSTSGTSSAGDTDIAPSADTDLRADSETAYSTHIHSLGMQTKFPFGQVAAWWQHGQEFPLIKVQLYGSEKKERDDENGAGNANAGKTVSKAGQNGAGNSGQGGAVTYSWRTTAYIHREKFPRYARLSKTIQKSRFWGSQNLSVRAPDLLDTRVSADGTLIEPLDADTMAVRLKLGAESGPEFLRFSASATCRDAGSNCRQTDWKGGLNLTPWELWALGASARVRHDRPEGFSPPHLEFSSKFTDSGQSYTKFTFFLPKGRPRDDMRLRSEFLISGDYLDISLVCTFKDVQRLHLTPLRGFAEAKVRF